MQTGICRTGSLYCYQLYDVIPDIMTSAKGLGCGFPIGAVLASEQVLAIEQISLDEKGVGQVTVTPRAAESYYVVVTFEGGKEITQVKS